MRHDSSMNLKGKPPPSLMAVVLRGLTPRPGFEPGIPEGTGLAILRSTRLSDRGILCLRSV